MRPTVLAILFAMLAAPAAFAQAAGYRIQPGDSLAVTVLEDDTLNRQLLVLPDGRDGRMVQIAHVPRGPLDTGDVDDVTDPASLGPKTSKRAEQNFGVDRFLKKQQRMKSGCAKLMYLVGGAAEHHDRQIAQRRCLGPAHLRHDHEGRA